MARTRKTSDTPSPEAAERQDKDGVEDALVLGETPPADETPSSAEPEAATIEETAPEASPEIAGADEVVQGDADLSDGTEPVDAEIGPAPEPAREEPPPKAAPPAPPPARRGASVALPLIFGGVIAALAGFAASRFVFPDGWPGRGDTQSVLADLRGTTEAQTARIAELEAALTALRDEMATSPDPADAIASLQDSLSGQVSDAAAAAAETAERVGGIDAQLADLAARVEELARRPAPEGLDPASLDAELSRFQAELTAAVEEARSGIVTAQEEAATIARRAAEDAAAQEAAAAEAAEATRAAAEAAAEAAARQAAVARILAALDGGEPYAEDLAALGSAEVPAALAAPAADGVPTLKALSDAFPDAARDALDSSIRAEAGEGAVDRLTAFLRVQTGARSLEPREGTDPDAVLSRSEAALRAGDLEAALSELGALPEAGQAEMAGWIQAARTRLEAQEAARGLSQD